MLWPTWVATRFHPPAASSASTCSHSFRTTPATQPILNDPTAINFNFNNQDRADNLVFKSDYHFNERHTVSGRYLYTNSTQTEEDGTRSGPTVALAHLARRAGIGRGLDLDPELTLSEHSALQQEQFLGKDRASGWQRRSDQVRAQHGYYGSPGFRISHHRSRPEHV